MTAYTIRQVPQPRFLCCDPTYPEGTPSDQLLCRTFYTGPRFVAFPTLWPYVGHCLELGLKVELVIARESGDPAQYMDWATSDWMKPRIKWVIGNEPTSTGPSSWTMDPTAYGALWGACRGLSGERWIAGLADGDWTRAVPYLQPDAAGLVIHIYGLSPAAARSKVAQYRTALKVPIKVGETNPSAGYRLADYTWDVPVNDFCFADAQVPGMGLYT